MKLRILPLLVAGLMSATFFLSSCLGNDTSEIEYPATSSIKSFSIGTLYQTFYVKSSKGKDSAYVDTVSYADHVFTIDQINRRIYNKDSLPKEVDITRVVTSIEADIAAIYYEKNGKDTIWTSTDSLDFTNDITFKVMAFSEVQDNFIYGQGYKVSVNVHKLNPDSLVWKHFDNSTFGEGTNLSEQKSVYQNNNIYVFGKTSANEIKVFRTGVERGNTSGWEDITPAIQGINIYSALPFKDEIYYVAEGRLYKLSSVSPIGELNNLVNLISTTDKVMYAYTTDNKVYSINADGSKEQDLEFIAGEDMSGRLYAISQTASHNSSLWRTTVMKNGAETDTTACIYSYTSSDEAWVKYQPNNPTTCPNQKNISMIKYDGKLFAFGGLFDKFYSSVDNGLNWNEETGYMIFPTEEKNGIKPLSSYRKDGTYSTVVEDNGNKGSFMWFIWQDGTMTRGHLNRLMPKE